MITTNTGLKTLFNFSLMLVMICSPISTAFSQQTLSSTCTSLKRMDIEPIGIRHQGNKNISLPDDTKKITMECTCRYLEEDIEICPSSITFTVRRPNGTIQNISASREDAIHIGGDFRYQSSIYRAKYNGAADRVTYNAPSSATLRSAMRGLVVWIESEGRTPNNPNNYEVDEFFYKIDKDYYINVPTSSNGLRNFVISVPVHEHGDDGRESVYQVRGYNGNSQITPTVTESIPFSNLEPEIRLDEIPLNNVPANVNRIRVNIESPDNNNGSSAIVGSIMVTSSTPCCVPTLTCPSNITRSTAPGACYYQVVGGELDPTFSCSATPTNGYNGSSTLADATFPVGTTTVTWLVSGATCQTTITVEDNEAPVLTCPSDITIATDTGLCVGTYDFVAPTATDNCDSPEGITIICSHESGDTFPSGTTTVTCTAMDASGNTDTCSFDITVEDTEAPFMNCLSDITVTAEAGECEASPEWTLPRALDNCDLNQAIVDCNYEPGDTLPIGVTTVMCTATDAAGNSISHSFDIIVEQCDTCVTTLNIIHIDDNDINVGTNDMENFFANPVYRFFNPGLPETGILTNVTLELHLRVFDISCENEIEVRVTDPLGNITTFDQSQLFSTCNGAGLYYTTLDLPDVPLEGNAVGIWYIEFRDINDQNAGAREYSTRFAQLTYDATFDECYDVNRISRYNENELLSELSEVHLYPVPTSDVLNMEYTSDEDTDLSIEIIDNVGRAVGYQKESVISGVNTFNMNVDDLAQGLYYVRIMDDVGRMQVKPFTKVNP